MQLAEHSATLAGPVLVTVAYFVLWYYLLVFLQRSTKYRLQRRYQEGGDVFDRYFGQDEEMLAADRAVANTQEQMGPFLVSFWLFALFVSPAQATWLGAAYVCLRALYPMLLGRRVSKMQPKRVYFATLPAYGIVFYMFGQVAWSVLR
ncbi:MAPEG family protein [Immundisolibacter sp.]|uniref:MAPEG family protein n=1 Tax=Immundisolibacter sp. TaxID=1934948 RepID=UPI0035687E01